MNKMSRGLLFFLAFGVAGYAAFVYLALPLGVSVHPDMKESFTAHPIGIYSHIFASIVALALGPIQFSMRFRDKHRNVHRWMGRIYLAIGVLIGGVAGLYFSQYATGGPVAKLGFATLALFWLYTGYRAFTAIRQGEVAEHRKWMVRNYSLTFAAVTLRLYLPLSMVAGIEFLVAYPAIAWLCWVPNLLVAEWRFNRTEQARGKVPELLVAARKPAREARSQI